MHPTTITRFSTRRAAVALDALLRVLPRIDASTADISIHADMQTA